jgi:hypothetical protein
MCNLYSLTKGQAAVRDWFRARNDRTGNLPLFPGIFPDQMAPDRPRGERRRARARHGALGHAVAALHALKGRKSDPATHRRRRQALQTAAAL